MAQAAHATLKTNSAITTSLLDMREKPLPLCDGHASFDHPHVEEASNLICRAQAILLATPIYNYDANAVTKNLLENTGKNWENKTVGFLCAAGGHSSYMSIMGLANSLMLDFRCLIVPRFVYASGKAFEGGRIIDSDVTERIATLTREIAVLAEARQRSLAEG